MGKAPSGIIRLGGRSRVDEVLPAYADPVRGVAQRDGPLVATTLGRLDGVRCVVAYFFPPTVGRRRDKWSDDCLTCHGFHDPWVIGVPLVKMLFSSRRQRSGSSAVCPSRAYCVG